jgi:cation:H+ antiporter
MAVGFVLLVIGGELLVRGAVRAAQCLGVSPLMIGIVLVGFGTSAPEMAISVYAAMQGSPGIAVGNFVGSSIANILLILGLSAMIMPVAVESRALSRDGIVVLLSALVFAIGSLFWPLDRPVGVIFLLWLISYLIYAWRQEKVATPDDFTSAHQRAAAHEQLLRMSIGARLMAGVRAGMPIGIAILLAAGGLALLILGGRLLVDGAVEVARAYQVGEDVIGLTIIAVGTSMPELVTSLVAALRSQPAVAVGNILGSNIYNVLGVGGITAVLSPTVVPERIAVFDNFVMVAAALALVLIARTGMRITRLEGTVLFVAYGAYLYSLLPAQILQS